MLGLCQPGFPHWHFGLVVEAAPLARLSKHGTGADLDTSRETRRREWMPGAPKASFIMAGVVQAACPGCKKVLRIPAEWMHRVIRCKHCGMTVAARPAVVVATVPPGSATPSVPVASGSQARV